MDRLAERFRAQNPQILLRRPEPTTSGHSTSFNRVNIEQFFSNPKSVLEKLPFNASDIYNCDENSVTLVHVPPKVFRERGQMILCKTTSSERGVLVTLVGTVSASSHYLPP